jgi:hypothetical protein
VILARVREEAIDRFGRLPQEVETLFAVASLRVTCRRLGSKEVTTYKEQCAKPLSSPARSSSSCRNGAGATYHRTTATLNLAPERVVGDELPGWVERASSPRRR